MACCTASPSVATSVRMWPSKPWRKIRFSSVRIAASAGFDSPGERVIRRSLWPPSGRASSVATLTAASDGPVAPVTTSTLLPSGALRPVGRDDLDPPSA